jgi:hypothetical protein
MPTVGLGGAWHMVVSEDRDIFHGSILAIFPPKFLAGDSEL